MCSATAIDCSPPIILVNDLNGDFGTKQSLRSTDLRVDVDHKLVQILSISQDTRPRRIVLMVDTSGSMETSPRKRGWGITLPAAAYAVDVVPNSASAALVTFSDKLQQESGDFENRNTVGAKVLELKGRRPHGGTLLLDSIGQALINFTELRFGDAIYVVTDGGDTGSKTSLRQLRQELAARGIRVFVFLVLGDLWREKEDAITGAQQMEDLAEFTGGEVVRISSTEVGAKRAELDNLAPHIIGQVENVYRLELGVSSTERPARVEVSFVGGNGRKRRSIAYSHEIVPCPRARASAN